MILMHKIQNSLATCLFRWAQDEPRRRKKWFERLFANMGPLILNSVSNRNAIGKKLKLEWTHILAPRMDLTLMMTLSGVCVLRWICFAFFGCHCRRFHCSVFVYPPYTRKSLSQMSRIYSKIFLYFVSKIHTLRSLTRSHTFCQT